MPSSTRASELQSCSLVAWPQTRYLSPSLSFFRKVGWSPLWGPHKDGARRCMWVPSTTPLSPPSLSSPQCPLSEGSMTFPGLQRRHWPLMRPYIRAGRDRVGAQRTLSSGQSEGLRHRPSCAVWRCRILTLNGRASTCLAGLRPQQLQLSLEVWSCPRGQGATQLQPTRGAVVPTEHHQRAAAD